MKKFIYLGLLALGVVLMVAPPVMAQEEKPFTIHGEVRYRGEYDNNTTDFDDNTHDSAQFWPYRVRIAAEGHFSKNVSAWIEFQNANVSGTVGPGGTRTGIGGDGTTVELYQGNVTFDQLWSKNFSLRIGRQEIVAGNELLLGDLDFYTGITHDGGVGNWKLKKVNLMVWYTRPNETQVAGGNTSPDTLGIGIADGTQDFWGGYATWNYKRDQSFDIYLMDLDTRATSNVQTVGIRYAHDQTSKDGFIWDAEVAQQFGDASFAADSKARGRAIEGWFGYNFKSGRNVHRIYGRLESATGDKLSSTDKNEGFIPMFGDFHNRTGRGDWFRLQDDPTNGIATTNLGGAANGGLVALSVGYNGFFNDRHEFGAAFWKYDLQEDNGGDKDLGKAIDVWYGFNYSRNVNFVVSLSQLDPGDALTGGGGAPNDSVRRLYGQARLRF